MYLDGEGRSNGWGWRCRYTRMGFGSGGSNAAAGCEDDDDENDQEGMVHDFQSTDLRQDLINLLAIREDVGEGDKGETDNGDYVGDDGW